ncbi:DNA-processing protein DprA [Rufibacter aurantiacus]|uniref:DNA-processing protein DprA n=1 Tax=Rufibacter aurantiacus TaxID=2817374 RepID=UPI001B3033BA|nr:DNA-processing protein DprA [Rufibacter aurantiacus]
MIEPSNLLLLENISCITSRSIETVIRFLTEYRRGFPSANRGVVSLFAAAYNRYGTCMVPPLEAISVARKVSERIMALSGENGIRIISRFDADYPKAFRLMEDMPLLVHVKGNLEVLNNQAVAILGKKEPSAFTRKEGPKVAQLVSREGFTIVSGLAAGCDSISHRAAVESHAPTIAVMAGGLHDILPGENQNLSQRILEEGGLLLSEYAYGEKARRGTYIARGRLQTALSKGVIILETDLSGGTMESVRYAAKQKKKLGCLYPSLVGGEYNEQFAGNQFLMNKNKAVKLDSQAVMSLFLSSLQNKVKY